MAASAAITNRDGNRKFFTSGRPLQPRLDLGQQDVLLHREAGPAPYQHELCRAPEFDHADADPAVYAAGKRLLKEGREPRYSVAIHFMHYNFVRIHQSLRITPAMAAGVTTKLWLLTDMVRVSDEWEVARAAKIGGDTLIG